MASLWNIAVNNPLDGAEANVANLNWYLPDGSSATSVSEYKYDAYNLLFSTELTNWEAASTKDPYQLDLTPTLVQGDPTVGIGFDLYTNPDALTRFFKVTYNSELYDVLATPYANVTANGVTYTATDQFTTALAGINEANWNISESMSKEAFQYYEQKKEDLIDNLLYEITPGTGVHSSLPDSTSRLALLDLAYNSTLLNPHKSPTLFSDLGKLRFCPAVEAGPPPTERNRCRSS